MKKYYLLLLTFLCTLSTVYSQNLDTYNFIKTTINGYDLWAYDFTSDDMGNIYAIGKVEDLNTDEEETVVLKYLPNGVLDNSFGVDGAFTYDFGANTQAGADIEIDNNGKIVITGTVTHSNTDRDIFIARLTQNGTLDTSFNSNGIVSIANGYRNLSNKILITPDGKILVGATIATNTNTSLALIRLNDDGSYDSTFNLDGISTIDTSWIGSSYNSIVDLHIFSDGTILALASTGANILLVKYTAIGNLDTTYGGGNGIFVYEPSFAEELTPLNFHLNSDNSLFILTISDCIGCDPGLGSNSRRWIFKIDANGAFDTSFSGDGRYFVASELFPQTAMAVSAAQEVYVGVEIYGNFEVRKLMNTGNLDTSFHGDGSWNPTAVDPRKMYPFKMTINSSNELMIMGKFNFSGLFLNNFFFYSVLPTQNNVILSVEETVLDGKFALYPNPTKDVFYVKNDNFNTPVTIEIYNSLGMRLFTKEISNLDNSINLKGYPSGMYYAKVNGTNTTKSILKN